MQERLDRGARQRHDRLARHAALFRRSRGGRHKCVGEAGAVVLAELHEPLLLVAEQMVAERGAEMGEALVNLGHAGLCRIVEAGAGAAEAGVGAFQQPHLLASQAEGGALLVQHGDAAKQHSVHHDRIPVPRHPGRHLLVDLQDRRARMRRDQVVEHRRDLRQQFAGALQRGDGVVEVGQRRIVGDRSHFRGMIGEGLLEGGQEMLRLDLGERRRLERRPPCLQEGVGKSLSLGVCAGF
ncbi:hypothetical protein ACVIM8_000939 [Bradyrhizobium sp. USDA 4529]